MLVVNMLGVPGSGKSTAAAYIFYKLKEAGVNCELVTEVAKDMVWDNNNTALCNQLYVAGSQSYRLDRLNGKVDVVVTDAPLMLQPVYYRMNKCPEPDMFDIIMYRLSSRYDNYNYVLPIPTNVNTIGRIHDINSASMIHASMINLLDKYNIYYKTITTRSEHEYDIIADSIMIRLGVI